MSTERASTCIRRISRDGRPRGRSCSPERASDLPWKCATSFAERPAGIILHAICRRDDTGKVIRWTGSSTDITERKLAEEGLKTMERKLRQAQRLEAMGTLAGGIAHDFNNILGAILGYGEMALRDAPKGSRLARDLDSIMVAGERGRALVERVLAFSRSAVGEVVPVHVERVVREVLDLVSAKLPSNVTVQAELHAGRAAVLGDATQVHQVVANLATNAIQAMPSWRNAARGARDRARRTHLAPRRSVPAGLENMSCSRSRIPASA